MFLTRGAVYPGMPPQFAYPAAVGDFPTALLASISIRAVAKDWSIGLLDTGVLGTCSLGDPLRHVHRSQGALGMSAPLATRNRGVAKRSRTENGATRALVRRQGRTLWPALGTRLFGSAHLLAGWLAWSTSELGFSEPTFPRGAIDPEHDTQSEGEQPERKPKRDRVSDGYRTRTGGAPGLSYRGHPPSRPSPAQPGDERLRRRRFARRRPEPQRPVALLPSMSVRRWGRMCRAGA